MSSTFNIKNFVLFLNLYNFVYSEDLFDLETNSFKFTTVLGNVSQRCRDQIQQLDQWTLSKLFDASSKLSSGVLVPLNYHFGQFEECYNIEYNSDIYGKYCLGLRVSQINPLQNIMNNSTVVLLHFGYCLVEGCTAEDFHIIFNWLTFHENNCYTKPNEKELSTGAIITITILAFFIALVVLSTIYDIWLYYTEKKSPFDFLVAFSALTNGRKLIQTSNNPNQLPCLNGLKAISMIWVVLFHEYMHALDVALTNTFEVFQWMNNWINCFITEGTVSVDTFLTISGILVVYTMFRTMDRTHEFQIVKFYVHRYIRLTPLVAIMVLMHAELFEYLGNGPLWSKIYNDYIKDCRKYWWAALLYIQNYIPDDYICVPQTWYLNVDFQLYLLSPIVLLTLRKSRKIGLYLLGILIILGFVAPIVTTWIYEIEHSLYFHDPSKPFVDAYYIQTYTRFGPYVIGMLAGYYIYNLKKSDKKLKLSIYFVLVAWGLSLLTLLACLMGPFDIIIPQKFTWKDAIAHGFVRNCWSIGLCILIILCVSGHGGPIDWFLSLPVFQIITKLSYSIYMVHYWVIALRYLQIRNSFVFSNTYMMWSFWGDFALITALAIVFYFAFESPILILERYIFLNRSRNTTK